MKTISVAVPTRSRPRLLDECLRSIVNQTVPAAEIVVSDDGADAETAAVVRRYVVEGSPVRHVCNVPPLGQLGNRQRAFLLTTGDFVAMLDDDDAWEKDFLSETSRVLQTEACGFCSTDHYIMDAKSCVLPEESETASKRFGRANMAEGRYGDVLHRELVSKPFPLQFTLFARPTLESIGFFPTYAGTVPDFALFLELGAGGVAGFFIAKRLGRYRVHEGQQTHSRSRVENAQSLVACLRGFAAQHPALTRRERTQTGRLYREAVLELAIAYAHVRSRRASIRTLREYDALGWGWPRPSRVIALTALIAGARKRRPTSSS